MGGGAADWAFKTKLLLVMLIKIQGFVYKASGGEGLSLICDIFFCVR